ncbi:MAG TPA: CcdB family protein [Dokdonella sp.]|jgi:toxin CcdB|nr:CcdB family protein [Rhodanobacteraceae bacterium]HQV49868.1 CcdB family protein [Dokdonella sp.]HQX34049.1 CcdB family protein [Dokdonella sp.]
MPQFAVHRNTNPATRSSVPFLLDVQSDLIEELGTRVVVPLYTVAAMKGKTLKVLTPIVEVDGKRHVMVTQQLAGIAKSHLGQQVASLASQRNVIIAALDFLISGI